MRIGYACLTVGVPNLNYRTCTQKYASEEKLRELITHNLQILEEMIEYNKKNKIKICRISSDIIPFGSSPINTIPWKTVFSEKLIHIGNKIKEYKMRVSMHPGQYTVINSLKADVIARAIEDLRYHTDFLNSLGLSMEHKIVLHIGGVYNDKEAAIDRFMIQYDRLDKDIKERLIIENDDISYNIAEVVAIGKTCKIPVVFDNLHHACLPSDGDDAFWIEEAGKTWKRVDGPQKIHYSEKESAKGGCSHSKTIGISSFLQYLSKINAKNLDIMLEVKDKNLSAIKCILATTPQKKITYLEEEWSLYKYFVLERSQKIYHAIRVLLKEKGDYPVVEFYKLIEQAINQKLDALNAANAALHVWGYFKDLATNSEKMQILKKINALNNGLSGLSALKKALYRLSEQYDQSYLLKSYYFSL